MEKNIIIIAIMLRNGDREMKIAILYNFIA